MQHGLERVGGSDAGGAAGIALRGVQRNEIDVGVQPLEQTGHAAGMLRRIVLTLDQGPAKEDPASRRLAIGATGGHQVGQRPATIAGHEGAAFFISGGMQAHRQIVRRLLLRHAQDAGDHTHRADADFRRAQVYAAIIGDDAQSLHDGIVIVQGLAHAHEHQVAQPGLAHALQQPLSMQHLGDDLTRSQVAHETHLAGGAEDAAHRAARLSAQTGGEAPWIAHHHGLDLLAIIEPQEQLAREFITALDPCVDRRDVERHILMQMGIQPAAQGWRQVIARGEIPLALPVHGTPERACMMAGKTIGHDSLLEFGKGEVMERNGGH